ncbi:MAG: methytransferase partner Trm112 [Dehalococcoidia bacterium]|nr:methytransferase partner Trm112 [Dehalococcoidia bacterium]
MRKELMDILACPLCKEALELQVDEEEGEEVIRGLLHCSSCSEDYPIEGSVPNLLPPGMWLGKAE